ncbi:hypothetical protein GOODEAATRI_002771 [Goodea atripinnis]|uniref:Uncharacterized protein n=1 Tax=Goodea atripinnis TaxID=208336 RepID=A0ABV0PV69_9TELE
MRRLQLRAEIILKVGEVTEFLLVSLVMPAESSFPGLVPPGAPVQGSLALGQGSSAGWMSVSSLPWAVHCVCGYVEHSDRPPQIEMAYRGHINCREGQAGARVRTHLALNEHRQVPRCHCTVNRWETRLAVPSANSAESRPIPLDPLDLILVLDVVAGWLHCVTLAQPLTQYRYVPCGPDYQGTV